MREQRPSLAQSFIKQTEGQGLQRSGYHNESCNLRNHRRSRPPVPVWGRQKRANTVAQSARKPWPCQTWEKQNWEGATRGRRLLPCYCTSWSGSGVGCWSVIFAERTQPYATARQMPGSSQKGRKRLWRRRPCVINKTNCKVTKWQNNT